jgi:hypothetical protein
VKKTEAPEPLAQQTRPVAPATSRRLWLEPFVFMDQPSQGSAKPSQTARSLAALWDDHVQALKDNPLPYIDQLIDELLRERPLCPDQLAPKLYQLVPDLQLRTARHLVNLKFGNPPKTELLTPVHD